MSEFSNPSVNLENVPDFKSIELTPVHPKFRRILSIRYSIALILSVLVISTLIHYVTLPLWSYILMIFVALTIFVLLYLEFFEGFLNRKFGIRELEVWIIILHKR